jgi:transposase
MIGVPASVRILPWSEPVDGRKGFNGLAILVRSVGEDPFSGHLYVFLCRRRHTVKLLTWQRGGLLLTSKRLDRGRFQPPTAAPGTRVVLDGVDLSLLLDGAEAEGRTEPSPQDEQTARRKIGRAASEPTRAKSGKARAESAPILEQTIEVTEEDIPDGMSLDAFRRLGQGETRTIVSYVKGHYVIKRYTLQTMQHVEQSNVIVQAKMPERSLVAGGKYDVTCCTQCVLSRILDVMPLQRQARQSARAGYAMAPSVPVNLFHRAAFMLTGVYQQIVQQLQQANFICGDETPQPMLAPGKGKTVRGWMWMALCDTAITYYFDVSRSTEAGKILLGDSVRNIVQTP